ncbi:TadE family type IV pilus minor pilin [Salinibacterium sp. G-O1]|uniref:TadE family type IV pilus minor pilin n=1 Tax=Salinibacterium sp. G-O1 TaxID=3046208 RepID=UPI0024B9DE1D|nr:TadE family type IV pilus minor pilin [Salinibacterium sp. G-O1]MDJ0334270.1 TadE family type IV pilus minor pilin [Salinibacterium sp. G-O1]
MTARARGRRRARDDGGSVTAEFAVTMPAVILLLACCLSGVQVAAQQLRLQDAAASAARSLARGDSAAATVARLEPGASVTERSDGELDCVTLTTRSTGVVGVIGGFTLAASSCALGGGR